ncbi:TadE/TadG family type IV pilus assembly protein [Maritalea sp.]|uniref:TadE/TadG family type IV pilus assembly protein n=1 Tax=Maritalea sp. TaxID=2003361 RepID=UPI003EFA26E4
MITLVVRIVLSFAFLLNGFRKNDRAVAAVEFALILPVLLFTYIGIAESSRLIIMDRRLAVVAGSVGDLVARADGVINRNTVDDYFEAAEFTMAPYPSADLKQVVTSVDVDDKGVATVEWSRGYNGGTAHAQGATVALPPHMAVQSKEKHLIIGEATTEWRPIIEYVFQSGFTLSKTYYYRPRFDAGISLN